MCIAIVKPSMANIPKMETFEECFRRNRDGAGVVWTENDVLHIKKGLMTIQSFKMFIEDLSKRIDTTKELMGFHFRITTHGGTSEENTHPFPISSSMSDLKETSFETTGKVAIHNGIIPRFDGTLKNSDTQEFIVEFLAPLTKACSDWDKKEDYIKMVDNLLCSKMGIFNTDKTFTLIGSGWITDEGVHYSNSSYKPYNNNSLYRNYGYGCYNYKDDYDDTFSYLDDDYYDNSSSIANSINEVKLCYVDNDKAIILTKKDYNDKKYENDLLSKSSNCVYAITIDNKIYKYNIFSYIFELDNDVVILDKETKELYKYEEKLAYFDEVR